LPLDGRPRASGYKLVFTGEPGDYWKSVEDFRQKGASITPTRWAS